MNLHLATGLASLALFLFLAIRNWRRWVVFFRPRLRRLAAYLDGNPLAIALIWTLAIGLLTLFSIRWPR